MKLLVYLSVASVSNMDRIAGVILPSHYVVDTAFLDQVGNVVEPLSANQI